MLQRTSQLWFYEHDNEISTLQWLLQSPDLNPKEQPEMVEMSSDQPFFVIITESGHSSLTSLINNVSSHLIRDRKRHWLGVLFIVSFSVISTPVFPNPVLVVGISEMLESPTISPCSLQASSAFQGFLSKAFWLSLHALCMKHGIIWFAV